MERVIKAVELKTGIISATGTFPFIVQLIYIDEEYHLLGYNYTALYPRRWYSS
jgi:hypothetical protein